MIVLILSLSACSNLLPSTKKTISSPWHSFDEAKLAFDKIIPQQTTLKELKSFGFDPFDTPNIKLITYLDLINKFLPNQSIRKEDLDPYVQQCLQKRENCQGYEVTPSRISSKRYGNLFFDFFNFRKKTRTEGWAFSALIVLENNLVVYKLWGGDPIVLELDDKKNPLGIFEGIGDVIRFVPVF